MALVRAELHLLTLRFVALAKSLEDDRETRDALVVFRAFRAAHFPPGPVPALLSLRTVTVQGTLDFMIAAAVNAPALDEHLYRLMYWASFLLLYAREKDGRQLMRAMEGRGFVFAENVSEAVRVMQKRVRNTSLWKRVKDHVDQLCAALSQPPERTVAGVFNNIVDRCGLPLEHMITCTKRELRKNITDFFEDPLFREAIKEYVRACTGGNRQRKFRVKTDDDEGTVAVFMREPQAAPSPVFATKDGCIDFVVSCAVDLFLPESRRPSVAACKETHVLSVVS